MVSFVFMPQQGLNEPSAVLAVWHVSKGDTVKPGDALFDVETGKAIFTVESELEGVVLQITAQEGDEVPVKQVVCVIGKEGEDYVLPPQHA